MEQEIKIVDPDGSVHCISELDCMKVERANVRHEVNRILNIRVNTPSVLEWGKARADLLNDLGLITDEEYFEIVGHLDNILA